MAEKLVTRRNVIKTAAALATGSVVASIAQGINPASAETQKGPNNYDPEADRMKTAILNERIKAQDDQIAKLGAEVEHLKTENTRMGQALTNDPNIIWITKDDYNKRLQSGRETMLMEVQAEAQKEWAKKTGEREKQIAQLDGEIARKREQITQLDSNINAKQGQLTTRQSQLDELNQDKIVLPGPAEAGKAISQIPKEVPIGVGVGTALGAIGAGLVSETVRQGRIIGIPSRVFSAAWRLLRRAPAVPAPGAAPPAAAAGGGVAGGAQVEGPGTGGEPNLKYPKAAVK